MLILAIIILGLMIGSVIGLIIYLLIDTIFDDEYKGTIAGCICAIIAFILVLGLWIPIHTVETTHTATIMKMEESATRTTIHRHVYAVTDEDEGVCFNVDKADYAILDIGDKISVNKIEQDHLLSDTTISYKMNNE